MPLRDWLAIVRGADPDYDKEAPVVVDYRFRPGGKDGEVREFKHRQLPGVVYSWMNE